MTEVAALPAVPVPEVISLRGISPYFFIIFFQNEEPALRLATMGMILEMGYY